MSRGADLFVVCKNPECRSEVSPYVTECPYCGTRLRKRAPKLERGAQPPRARRRLPTPALSRLRRDEIPGIRGDGRPYVTGVLVLASCLVWVAGRSGVVSVSDLALNGPLSGDWWRVLATQFTYISGVHLFGVVASIAVFGWLLERRHGPLVVAAVFLAAGAGGTLLELALSSDPVAWGAHGAALGLLCAWALPDVLARRRGQDDDADLLAAGVTAVALLLVPLARTEASELAGAGGAAIGILAGAGLARLRAR